MKHRMKKMRAAVVAAIGAFSAVPALALPPGSYVAGTTVDVYLSGASAQDAGLRATIARACVPGTLDRYDISSTQVAFLCQPAASLGLGTATSVAIYKSSVAGSGNGVLPLLGTGAPLAFASFTSMNTTNCPVASSGTPTASITISGDTLGVPSYTIRSCATSVVTASVRPDGGLSDVEPPIFTTKSVSTIAATSANSVTFGFIVSKNLYRALQRAQGLDWSTTSADTTVSSSITGIATLPVNDNEANMPSLTRDTIATVMSGQYTDWGSLQVTQGTASVALTTFSGNDPGLTTKPAPTDTNIYIARRVPSSGTQKASEIFLYGGTAGGGDDGLGFVPANGYPKACNPTALAMAQSLVNPASNAESTCTTGASLVTVFNGSGTGNVRNCVLNHYTDNRWAIGIASTESTYSGSDGQAAKNYRFIKVDGFSPSLLNVYNNKYKNWVSQSANKPAYFGSLSAQKQSAVNALFGALGSQSVLKAVNISLNQPFGAGALFALPENGAVPDVLPITQAQIQANPGLPLTRAIGGNTDNCQLPQYGADQSAFPPVPYPVPIN